MRALVTGHRGFIGRHFVAALSTQGYTVHGCDIARTGAPAIDCRDFFRKWRVHFDLVVHCAAIVGGRAKIEGQPLAIADNLSIDAEFFQWVLTTRPGHVIYFSSSAAYPVELQVTPGALNESDISLDFPQQPDAMYGWSKLTGERLARAAEAEGVSVSVFRPFSGYGEDQDLAYPFPSFADRAARLDDPFVIWGDGTQVRDWIHVTDLVGAVMAAITLGVEGPVNLGSGEPTSFLELASMFASSASYQPEVELRPEAPAGVAYRCADVTLMRSFYTPKVSLEEGVDRAISFAGREPAYA